MPPIDQDVTDQHGTGSIWVTGATGFIGSAACRALVAAGHAVTPVDRVIAEAPIPGTHPPLSLDLEVGPLPLDAETISPRTVVHLAALIPATFDDTSVARRNAQIDRNVFDFAVSAGADVVFASTGSVYGPGSGAVFEESGRTDPRGPYAQAKLLSEQRGTDAMTTAQRRFIALRISAPYGPGQQSPTVVQHFLRRAIGGESLMFHGSGKRVQDFVYVDDVAEAIVCAVGASTSGIFNVATGRPVSMSELANAVAEVAATGVTVGPSGEPDPQEGNVARYAVDAAARDLAWTARTALPLGLRAWRDQLAGEAG